MSIPLHLLQSRVFIHCDMDTRIAFKCAPNKLDVSLWDGVKRCVAQKAKDLEHKTVELGEPGQVFQFVSHIGKTFYMLFMVLDKKRMFQMYRGDKELGAKYNY